jgi:hypothetical protein
VNLCHLWLVHSHSPGLLGSFLTKPGPTAIRFTAGRARSAKISADSGAA